MGLKEVTPKKKSWPVYRALWTNGAAEPSDLRPSSGPPSVEGRSDSQRGKTEQRWVEKVTKVCGRVRTSRTGN